MHDFAYRRPAGVGEAVDMLAGDADAKALAGGQTLLPVLKQRLSQPSAIVDLADLGLTGVEIRDGALVIRAMTRHEQVASDPLVRRYLPGLADLAARIGDRQVRARGTIGGSLANNDPGACYPSAVLGLGATIHTDRRTLEADDFLQGLYATALQPAELIIAISFPIAHASRYEKFPHPASRFAMVGVFLSHGPVGVRVAVTGAAREGAFRWREAEHALIDDWGAASLPHLPLDRLNEDIHGDAAYRAVLAEVLLRRAVASLPPPSNEELTMEMAGERMIAAPRERVWAALNDPEVLRAAIPGCESLEGSVAGGMKATAAMKVGPISARFGGQVTFSDVDAPNGYTIKGEGQGGVAGFAKGGAKVELEARSDGTLLRYEVEAQVGGKIAQLGARLIDATAKKMADQFFVQFAAEVERRDPDVAAPSTMVVSAAPATAALPARNDGAKTLAYVAIVGIVAIVAIVAMLIYVLAR